MAEIKTDINTFERPIKIQWRAFDALFIMHLTCHHLGGQYAIQRPQLNRNDSHASISSKPLIKY